MVKTVLTLSGGKLKDNAQTLGAVSDVSITCPEGKRWLLHGGYIERDNAATVYIVVYNASDKILQATALEGAGAANVSWGCMATEISGGSEGPMIMHSPFPMKEGDYVKVIWSVAQTTPEVSLTVEEWDIEK